MSYANIEKIKDKEIDNQMINYQEYFTGTKPLQGNFEDPELSIKENVRKFRKSNEKEGYDEVFPNENQILFGGISPQISFIFPPNIRAFQSRIGFRFYKENPLKTKDSIPYFTLVNCGNRKFKILEKETTIKDKNKLSFSIENLDCLDIILNIIKKKILSPKNYFELPNTTAELLGFIYAVKIKTVNSSNNIVILDPYYPSPFLPKTMEEEYQFDESKIYLEPILFNKHVSLLLFKYYKYNKYNEFQEKRIYRKNILFDMSGAHYKYFIEKNPIFNEDMLMNVQKFPENIIQYGNSCSMWFYSTILVLIEKDVKLTPNNEILLKIINKLYELFKIPEEDIIMDINNNIIGRDKENVDLAKFISYKMVLKPFINIKGIVKQFYSASFVEEDYLEKYQKLFFRLRNTIDLYEINNKYNSNIFKKELFSNNYIDNLELYITTSENFFEYIIKQKRNIFDVISQKNTSMNLSEIKSNISQAEDMIFCLEKNFICQKAIMFTRRKLHKLCFDSSDVFLSLFDD